MATLSITKNYADGTVLFESDLDAIASSIETFLNVTKLNDDNIQDSGITASTKLVNASISEGKLGSNVVTDTKLRQSAGLSVIGRSANSTGNVADITAGSNNQVLMRTGDALSFAQVNTAQIANNAVTTTKINDGQITSAKIATGTITSTNLADNNVTQQKLQDRSSGGASAAAGEIAISASSGEYSREGSYQDITNLSVTLVTTGRPVRVMLIPDSTESGASVFADEGSGTVASGAIRFRRGSSTVAAFSVRVAAGGVTSINYQSPPGAFSIIDIVSAGTYTYTAQAAGTSAPVKVQYCKLVAYEI